MKLRDYLDEANLTPAAFAARLGVTPQTLYRYIAGDRQPRREVIDKIVLETGGKVGAGDLHESRAAA
jgi:predicted transcriptional regulator